MSESPPIMEVPSIKTKTLAEDAPRAWEGEHIFSEQEVMDALEGIAPSDGKKVTERVMSHDGTLLELYARVPGTDVGYQYVIKGANKNALDRTVILKIDYENKDSEVIYYAEEVAEYKDGEWKKL